MELPISAQALDFGISVLLGLGLSLFYDLLRGLRRAGPRLTWLWDLVFGLVFLLSLLWFMLYPGEGQFRLYAFLGLFLGACLWFLLPSGPFLRGWLWVLGGVGRIFRFLLLPVTIFLKKYDKLQKRPFQVGENGVE